MWQNPQPRSGAGPEKEPNPGRNFDENCMILRRLQLQTPGGQEGLGIWLPGCP